MSVTTKTGDDGYTGIIGGRLRKDHPVVECLGTLDELNAFLGDTKASSGRADCRFSDIITAVQQDLYVLMGILAGTDMPEEGIGRERIDGIIKEIESTLTPFTEFVVPGVNPVSAKLHIARTVCRRAERRLVGLDLGEEAKTAIVPYINRLSDLLFVLAQKEEQAGK